MSKWAVLKAALQGKPDEAAQRASIHRHDGFSSLLSRKKIVWTWTFSHWVRAPMDEDTIRSLCNRYVQRSDCAEVRVCFRVKAVCSPRFRALLKSLEDCDPGTWRLEPARDISIAKKKSNSKKTGKGKRIGRLEKFSCFTLFYHERSYGPLMAGHELCGYTVPGVPLPIIVYTREPRKKAGITRKGILSHLLHGVDNTGNIRVWTSECILLRILLQPHYKAILKNKTILEVGGGMTALCALGLALLTECGTVIATDGHPDSVTNQNVCIELCKQRHFEIFKLRNQKSFDLQAKILRWSRYDECGDLKRLLTNYCCMGSAASVGITHGAYPTFDVIIASDCLFFKDFHQDLYWLLKSVTAPGGLVFLLQPPRGGTLQLFVDIVRSESIFSCEILSDYLDEVSSMHQEYISASVDKSYDPDVHYPLLVQLTRL